MLYRPYGKTGKQISAISAGCMRFPEPDNIEKMAKILVAAARLGVNYFDTAPAYCNDKSETILGAAVREMKREGLQYYVSTKSGAAEHDAVMSNLEKSLKRIGVDHIDFYHSWCLNSWDTYKAREDGGAFRALRKAKDQGLISHVVVSSHMSGPDIAKLMRAGLFEGVTLGFCAINFPFRMEGILGAAAENLGVVTMNPLGGGLIPEHEQRFAFLKTRPEQSIVEAALHFNLAHTEITTALVGFSTTEHVRAAVGALDSFSQPTEHEVRAIKSNIEKDFDQLCTTCNYCDTCPQGIPVARFMEAYNHYMLYKRPRAAFDRLKWHWDIKDLDMLDNCTECRECEEKCTQKLPILDRFEHLRRMQKEMK